MNVFSDLTDDKMRAMKELFGKEYGVFAMPYNRRKGLVFAGGFGYNDNGNTLPSIITDNFHIVRDDVCENSAEAYAYEYQRGTRIPEVCFTLKEPNESIQLYNIGFHGSMLIDSAYAQQNSGEYRFDACIVQKLQDIKNWEYFVENAHALSGLRLCVVTWPDAQMRKLAAKIHGACAKHKFMFLNRLLRQEELNRLYNASKFMIIFSKSEGVNRVCCDARYCGCCIASYSKTPSVMPYSPMKNEYFEYDDFEALREIMARTDPRDYPHSDEFKKAYDINAASALLKRECEKIFEHEFYGWNSLSSYRYCNFCPMQDFAARFAHLVSEAKALWK